jgi:hypothetical protein
MFFSAIKDFGEGLDNTGISSITISGKQTNIIYIRYNCLLGIIFLSDIQVDDSILSFIQTFLQLIYVQNKKRLDLFEETGNIKYFDTLNTELFPLLENLDKDLLTIKDLQSSMAQDRLMQLFQNLTEKKYDLIDHKFLKNLIFRQLLVSSHGIIDEIQRYGGSNF